MRKGRALAFCLFAAGGCAAPIYLHTYSGGRLGYPDLLSPSRPTILAFLDGNDRRSDSLIRPLRSLSSRKEVKLVGVLTYEDSAFLDQISTRKEIRFPVMLDPDQRMVERFGIRRYPTFVYLSPSGKENGRVYDIREISPWYLPRSIRKVMGKQRAPDSDDLEAEEEP